MTECAQCGDSFTPTNKTGPKPRYCSSTCRDRHRTARATQEIRDARNARNCSACGEDITQTTHPLATRCESCQAEHRSTRKRPKAKVERFCDGCGKSINGTRKGKTSCADCGKPPRLCIDCGLVDLKGSRSWRCDDCKAEWDAGESERVRQWQADHPEATMLTRARARCLSGPNSRMPGLRALAFVHARQLFSGGGHRGRVLYDVPVADPAGDDTERGELLAG